MASSVQKKLQILKLKEQLLDLQTREQELDRLIEEKAVRDEGQQLYQETIPQDPAAMPEQPPIDEARGFDTDDVPGAIEQASEQLGKSPYEMGREGYKVTPEQPAPEAGPFGPEEPPTPVSIEQNRFRNIPEEPGAITRGYRKVMEPLHSIGDAVYRGVAGKTRAEDAQAQYERGVQEVADIQESRAAELEQGRQAVYDMEVGDTEPEAPADITRVAPEEDPVELGFLVKEKADETVDMAQNIYQAAKELPYREIAGELSRVAVNDAPLIALGYGGLRTLSRMATSADKITRLKKFQNAVNKMDDKQRKDLLTQIARNYGVNEAEAAHALSTTPGVAKQMYAKYMNALKPYPNLNKTAKLAAETGIVLSPSMLREGELASLEEIAVTGGLIGALKYVGGKIRAGRKAKTEQMQQGTDLQAADARTLRGQQPGQPGIPEPDLKIYPGPKQISGPEWKPLRGQEQLAGTASPGVIGPPSPPPSPTPWKKPLPVDGPPGVILAKKPAPTKPKAILDSPKNIETAPAVRDQLQGGLPSRSAQPSKDPAMVPPPAEGTTGRKVTETLPEQPKQVKPKEPETPKEYPFTTKWAGEIKKLLAGERGKISDEKIIEWHKANKDKPVPKPTRSGSKDTNIVKKDKAERIAKYTDKLSRKDSEFDVPQQRVKVSELPKEFTVDGEPIKKLRTSWNFVNGPMKKNIPFQKEYVYIDKPAKQTAEELGDFFEQQGRALAKKEGKKPFKFTAPRKRAIAEYLKKQGKTPTAKDVSEWHKKNIFKDVPGADDMGLQPDVAKKLRGQRGAVNPFPKKKIRLKKQTKAEKIFDWQRKETSKKLRVSPTQIKDTAGSAFIQYEYPIASRLAKTPEGAKAVQRLQLSRGSSGLAKRMYTETNKKIQKLVPPEAKEMFNNLLQAHRTIEVDKIMKDRFQVEALKKQNKAIELEGGVQETLPDNFKSDVTMKNPKGMTAEDAGAYIRAVKKEQPELYKQLEKGMKLYWDESRKQLKLLKDEGIISENHYNFLIENHKHYSPRRFLHHLNPDTPGGGVGKKITVKDSGIKALQEGSEEALVSDYEYLMGTVINNAQTRIFRNRANKELFDFAKAHPENEMGIKVEPTNKKGEYETIPDGYTRFSYMEEGAPKNVIMPDEMAKYWASSDPLIAGGLAKTLRAVFMAPILKAGATGLNPAFALSNIPRDVAYTIFKQHDVYSPILPVALYQLKKDMFKIATTPKLRKQLLNEYAAEGGLMDMLTQQGYLTKQPMGVPAGKFTKGVEKLQDVLGYVGTLSELWPRLALMKRIKEQLIAKGVPEKEAITEAAYKARTNLDFAQGGNVTKALDQVIPYLNPAIQGTRGLAQAIKENPKVAGFKIAQIIAGATALAMYGYHYHGEAMREIPEWEKRTGWIIPLGISFPDPESGHERHVYFKIPKDHGQMLWAQIGEQSTMAALGEDAKFSMIKDAAMDMAPGLLTMPPLLEALKTYYYNKDFYRNKDLWTGRELKSPKLEKWPSTPELWKDLGQITGLSPIRAEAAAKKIFPENLYSRAGETMWDATKRVFTKKESGEVGKHMWEKLASIPGMRRYLRATWNYRGDEVQDVKKAIRGKVPTHTEEGRELSPSELGKKVKEKELELNDMKQQNDYDLLMEIQATNGLDKDKAKKRLEKFLRERAEKERSSRIVQKYVRLKRKKEMFTNPEIRKILKEVKEKHMENLKKEKSK